jgi:hypothetical protein
VETADGLRWLVTWMPGRVLTWDQAVAAMTLAEEVELMPPDFPGAEWWDRMDALGAGLGLKGEDAMVLASRSPDMAEPGPPEWWDDPDC